MLQVTDPPSRWVRAELDLSVSDSVDAVVQIAVAELSAGSTELLTITQNDDPIPFIEIAVPGGGRAHRFTASAGLIQIRYEATVVGSGPIPSASPVDEIVYLRPSRYAEADRLVAVAAAEFGGIREPRDLLFAVSSWVGSHLEYVPGSSRPTDGAVETLLQREGVCRDYAHVVVALLRALDVPARLAAVYAPGLEPMDFHAVAEAVIDGSWWVVDATLLAPRSGLVRIATGRDAADTAFLSTYSGQAELLRTEVSATVSGDLPSDNILELVALR